MAATAAAAIKLWAIAMLIGAFGGCTAPSSDASRVAQQETPAERAEPDTQVLNAGDVLKISFPAASNLDTTQQIRRDGRINLAMVGEVRAAGKSAAQLEAELVSLYSPQLLSKEIKVTVESSSFAVFVSGAVLKPGKISPDRAVTALDAIMEAGGFDSAKADMKSVRVIRYEGEKTRSFVLDLEAVLKGKPSEPFYLRSFDIVYVPEKFSWF